VAVRAPELTAPGGVWLNTPAPLTLAALRGRIVVLDLWTLCCVNCLHILPALAKLEAAFPRDVVVIGVHSPKFPHERDPAVLQEAVTRLGITHPVLQDPDRHLWAQYAIRAWPTLVFVDPNGYVLGQASGEPDGDALVRTIGRMVRASREHGEMQPADLPLVAPAEAPTRFRYPGKIRPIPGRARDAACWALADAGHHQVVLLDDAGSVVARIGSGVAGLQDGPALRACFRDPQGVAADTDAIWVADTGNHCIRRIDLATGDVVTVAGTGARGAVLGDAAPALETALASPWDLVPYGGGVLFANAGTHQLGALDPAGGIVERLAGAGVEHLQDGPAAEAMLAQPSGLALDGTRLFFADSETSAIRVLDLEIMEVRTLAGTGLFDFGARNGPLAEAQFQHPLGVAMLGQHALLVADSYNNQVRVVDLWEGTVADLDDGFICRDPLCLPPGGEPAGVCADPRAPEGNPRILVVETTRHRILEIRPARRSYRTWAE